MPAVWWHVYPLGFLGAEREALPEPAPPVPRLRRVEPWLDHVAGLGCDGLALGPVFASETHGYDTVDHWRIDHRLGTEDDLIWLIARARERGIGVLLDGVFNHAGRSFTHPEWFRPGATFEGHARLPVLDQGRPEVADHAVAVMTHWLERGVAGWRLDAAYAAPRPFWREVSRRVHDRFPDAWLVGEVIHGDYAGWVAETAFDSVTQYELWKAIWSALNDRNFFELRWALERHNHCLETFAPLTFLGNHDVTRIASQLRHEGHFALALAILLTVGGVPAIYAGDELAFRGVKEHRAGGDDAIRPAFPEQPADLGPEGEPIERLHRQLIGLRRGHPSLMRAPTRVTTLTNTTLAYAAGDEVAVALNAGPDPARLATPDGDWEVAAGDGVLDGGQVALPGPGWAVMTAPGRAWAATARAGGAGSRRAAPGSAP
jgi:glycosidase